MNRIIYTICIFLIIFAARLESQTHEEAIKFDYAMLEDNNQEKTERKPFMKVYEKSDQVAKRKFTTTFLGIGANYLIPMGKLADVNDNAIGFNVQLESRRYCDLWWGLRADYFSLDSLSGDNIPPNNFKSIFTLSPSLKYVFCGANCQEALFKPYLNGLLNFSSIRAVDEKSSIGFGMSGGAGVLVPFRLFGLCWGADLNALYAAPNAFYRAEGRENVQYVNISLTLSVGL